MSPDAVGLDRNELGACLVAAGVWSPQDHAFSSLLALKGLRIFEALGAGIDHLGLERGHRSLIVHRKGGGTVTIPLAPRTARRWTRPSVIGSRARSSWTPTVSAYAEAPQLASSADWPSGGHHQAHRSPQLAPLVHHRRP